MTSTLATTNPPETDLQGDDLTSVINRFDALKIRIEQAQADENLVKFNYNTPAGNKAARSHVYNLRKLRSAIDVARKDKKAAYIEAGKRVDAEARELTDSVTALIESHETILKKIEQDEADRKARHQGEVDTLIDARTAPEGGWTLELVQIRLGVLRTLSTKRLENPEAYDFEEFTSSWLGELNIGIDFFERLLPELHAAANVKACWTKVAQQLHDACLPPETGWTEEILQERIQAVKFTQAFVANTPEDFQPVPPEFNHVLLQLSGSSVQLERVLELHSKAAIEAREKAEAEKAAAVEEAQRLWEEDQERKQREAAEARAAAEAEAEAERKKAEDERVKKEVQDALDKKKKEDDEKAAAEELSKRIVIKSQNRGQQVHEAVDAVLRTTDPAQAISGSVTKRSTETTRRRAALALAQCMTGLNRIGIAQAIVDGELHPAITVDLAMFE